MYVMAKVYVVTGSLADFCNSGYLYPTEAFVCKTYDEAVKLQQKMLSDPNYDDVWIDGPVEEEVWI